MNHESKIEQKAGQVEERVEESVYNAAQRERGVADGDRKKIRDGANVRGGETWGDSSGHSGTRAAYTATGLVVAGFIIGGVGLTVGPRVLLWIGVALIVLTGALGMLTHVWSDYRSEQ